MPDGSEHVPTDPMAARPSRAMSRWAKTLMLVAGVGGILGLAKAAQSRRQRPDLPGRPRTAAAILPRDMASDVSSSAGDPEEPAVDPLGEGLPEATGPEPPRPDRRWLRRLSNLMLLAGVLGILGVVAYFGVTCAITKSLQGDLREELEAGSPGIAAAEATLDEGQFTPMETLAPVTTEAGEVLTPEEQAALAAEAARRAELAAFKAAADAFEPTAKAGSPIGRLVIPSIDLDVVLVEGVGTRQLKQGPGHWPETPFPGQIGNFVISGHRTTWGAPFFKLNEVEVGDEIYAVLPYVIARYTVTRVIIVYPDEVEEVAQLGREQISLAACHPIYSARQRIVVQGNMVSFALLERPGG